jgi:HK97 family phage prohead protease
LWNHDSSRAPIARAVGVEVINDQLVIEMQFDMADPFAAEVAGKIQRGFINAGSVGFFPGQVKYRGDLDPEDPRYSSGYGIVASDNELVEFSITPVPANSSALLAASADAATDDDLRKLMANKANRTRLAALLAGGDPPTCTHDHSQDVKHADPLGWLRDTTPAQTDRLPFIKE